MHKAQVVWSTSIGAEKFSRIPCFFSIAGINPSHFRRLCLIRAIFVLGFLAETG